MSDKELGSLSVGRPASMAMRLFRAEAGGHMYYALAPTSELARGIILAALMDETPMPILDDLEVKEYHDGRPIRAVAIKSPDRVDKEGPDFLETHVAIGFEVA
jgi:hypothetical protein